MDFARFKKQEEKNTRKAVKREANKKFKESVGGSCYPRGDLQHPSMSCHGEECGGNILSIKGSRGLSEHFCINGCARSSSHCPRRRTSTRRRAGEAQTVGCVPIASAPSNSPATHVFSKRDLALSVHFRVKNTMLPINSILDSWNV